MQCLRTLGVLSVTLTLVCSMTLETSTTRYLEAVHSFKIGLGETKPRNISRVDFTELNLGNVTILTNLMNNNSTSYDDNVNNTSLGANQTGNDNLKSALHNEVVESRKIKQTNKKSSHGALGNFIRTNLKELKANVSSYHSGKHSTKIVTKTTKKPISKASSLPLKPKSSTRSPITFKLTKVTALKSYSTSTRKPTINIKLTTPRSNKPKPTVKNIITSVNNTPSNLKQNWYEEGVPYPNPMPEVTSSSPPFSIGGSGSEIFSSTTTEDISLAADQPLGILSPEIYSNSPSEPLQGVPPLLPNQAAAEDLESVAVSAPDSSANLPASSSNAISTFNLDMLPSSQLTRGPEGTTGSGCPTVHISSAVLAPLQRQECSDLSLTLNTHYHQNQDTRRPGISTYDAAEEEVIEAVEEEPISSDGLGNAGAGDPGGGIVADAPATYTGGGLPGGGSSGGTGGSGGSGGIGGDGGGNNGSFKLPDLKPMFDALSQLMRGLWWLLQKFMNPWLYIVPIVLFYKLGFLGILSLFPWWIPFVFLYFSVRTEEPKKTVDHVKHYHKPVVVKHPSSWYWDEHTKTWKDVLHPHDHRHRRDDEEAEDLIDDKIIRLGDKFFGDDEAVEQRYRRR